MCGCGLVSLMSLGKLDTRKREAKRRKKRGNRTWRWIMTWEDCFLRLSFVSSWVCEENCAMITLLSSPWTTRGLVVSRRQRSQDKCYNGMKKDKWMCWAISAEFNEKHFSLHDSFAKKRHTKTRQHHRDFSNAWWMSLSQTWLICSNRLIKAW